MTCDTYPNLLTLENQPGGLIGPQGKPVRTMLALSVAVHVGLLLVGTNLRITPSFERPLASYQISLVDLASPSHPAPRVSREVLPRPVSIPMPVTPAKAAEPPAPDRLPDLPRETRPEVAQVAKQNPVPLEPLPPPMPAREARSSSKLREALRGIELPPEAPAFEDLRHEAVPVAPKPAPVKPRTNVQALLNQLTVPEAPVLPSPFPETVQPIPKSQSRPSLSQELAKQLARLPAAPPVKPRLAEPVRPPVASSSAPQEAESTVVAKASGPLKPGARIQVPGLAPGFSHYLARIQNEISKKWIAPQVEAPEGAIQVVIKFRLHRSGTVSQVEIEHTSGNEYYDLAGKRAVLSAYPLPPFPNDLSHAYLDAHFSFTVGGQTG